VRLQLLPDGAVEVDLAIPETGTGSHTIMHSVLVDALGLSRDAIGLRAVSTHELPYAVAVGGQRVGVSQIEMAYMAAQALKTRIRERAAVRWAVPLDAVSYAEGAVRCDASGVTLRVTELLIGEGALEAEVQVIEDAIPREAVTGYCAQMAQVAVDTETGAIQVLELVSAHDVADVLEPDLHRAQIEGGVVMGMGFALSEDLGVVDGHVSAGHSGEYKTPTIQDLPPLRVGLLQGGIGVGVRKVKSIGEMANVPTAAAIANAVSDALGVTMDTLPLTPERVLAAAELRGGTHDH
jgi:CO/xanthine dehydrogenase Mo-binding subunit